MFRRQKLELSLTTLGAKAGAFAYDAGGKSWSFRLRRWGQKLELSLTTPEAKAGAFAYDAGAKAGTWAYDAGAKAGGLAYARGGKGGNFRLRGSTTRVRPHSPETCRPVAK